jgi:hypothetical protein
VPITKWQGLSMNEVATADPYRVAISLVSMRTLPIINQPPAAKQKQPHLLTVSAGEIDPRCPGTHRRVVGQAQMPPICLGV